MIHLKSKNKMILLLLGVALVQSTFSFEATVKWNDLHQNMQGFGGAAGHGARKWAISMSPANQQAVINLAFDTITGAGLSIIRLEVPYKPENINSDGSGAFGVKDDGQIKFLRAALQKNPDILYWAAPWSPPPSFKTINSSIGGKLATDHYQDYANFLSKYAQESKQVNSAGMYAISMQNEPHFNAPWDGCVYEPAEIRDFIKYNLGPTFKRDGVTAKIMMPEANWDQIDYYRPTLQDAAAAQYVDIVGLHFYHDSHISIPHPLVKAANKELWQTECSWAGNNGPKMIGSQFWYKKRHYNFTQSEANAWVYWWIWDSAKQEGLLTAATGWNYVETKRLWTLGNYSRFVKRGWRMMGMTKYDSNDSTVMVDAYRDETTGKFAILAANYNNMNRSAPVDFHLDGATATAVTPWITDETRNIAKQTDIPLVGGCFSATLPAMTVVTYVGTAMPLAPSSVKIDSFTCVKEKQIPGEANSLRWATTGASSVTIDNGVGTGATSGSAVVSPTVTTTYTLTSQGANGPVVRRVTIEVLPAQNPQDPAGLNNGLDYAYYKTNNSTYDDFSGLTPTSTGSFAQFSHAPRGTANTDFGFKISGYIDIPTDGVYTFTPRGFGTMLLRVDGIKVLNQDYEEVGYGNLIDFMSGSIGLKAGKHSIVLGTHFAFGSSDPWLKMEWEGPGIARQEIPAARLFHNGQPIIVGTAPSIIKPSAIRRVSHTVYNIRGQQIMQSTSANVRKVRHTGIFIDVTKSPGIHTAKIRIIAR